MSLLPRELTKKGIEVLERLEGSRTAERRLVDRARIVLASNRSRHICDVVRALGFDKDTIRLWGQRFCQEGIEGLRDRPRSGHPRVYTAEDRATVVATSLTNPRDCGLPFGEWTLERLAGYLADEKDLPMSPTRVGVVLREEGLRWKQQEQWLTSKAVLDPDFAQKRGSSSGHTQIRQRDRSSYASTKWGR